MVQTHNAALPNDWQMIMENLSIRKYATLIGVSHTSVIKAKKNGYIVDGWNTDIKK